MTVAAGKAQVTISFDAWKEGKVAVAHQEVEVAPAAPESPLATVSERLQGELSHANKLGMLQGIRFSPDGGRLLAGEASSGIIQMWDVASRKPLISIETGKIKTERFGGRGGGPSFALSPDWQKLYAKIGLDIGVWDTQTGRQIDAFQDKSATGIRSLMLSADGSALITTGGGKAGGALVWNTSSKQAQPVPGGLSSTVVSRDGKYLAGLETNGYYTNAIQVIDLQRQVKTTIAMPHKLVRAYVTDFTADGKLLRGAIETYEEHLWQKWEKWHYITKFWEVETGKEVASFPTEEPETTYKMESYSPDGNTLAATRWTPNPGTRAEKLHANLTTGAKLFLLDVPSKRTQAVFLEKDAGVGTIAFSPDSRWVAVVTQQRRRGAGSEAGDVDSMPQPRIHLVDAKTAQVRESLIAPPGNITALSFSPDGRTLASAGLGKVLLWSLPASTK